MNNQIYRHGDISFIPCELPKEAQLVEEATEKVFAYGEQTGHNHTMVSEPETRFKVFELNGERYFVLNQPVQLTHPEHKTIIVNPGTYVQFQEQEKDWFSLSVRKVID